MLEQIKRSAIGPALYGLCDLTDSFQPELLLRYFRAANLLCLYICKICTGTLVRHEASPVPQANDLFLQDEVHYSRLGKPEHCLFYIIHNLY